MILGVICEMTPWKLMEAYNKLKRVPAGKKAGKKASFTMKQVQKPTVVKTSAPAKKIQQSITVKAAQQPKRKGCCGR